MIVIVKMKDVDPPALVIEFAFMPDDFKVFDTNQEALFRRIFWGQRFRSPAEQAADVAEFAALLEVKATRLAQSAGTVQRKES